MHHRVVASVHPITRQKRAHHSLVYLIYVKPAHCHADVLHQYVKRHMSYFMDRVSVDALLDYVPPQPSPIQLRVIVHVHLRLLLSMEYVHATHPLDIY